MIVVDTNVIAYLYLPGVNTVAAEALLERDSDWAAPILWRSEFRNILAGYIRHGLISCEMAKSLQREAESLMAGAEFEVDSDRVLELARDSDCSAYDCEFIALSMHQNAILVTQDAKLLRAFPEHTRALETNKR